MLTQLQQKMMQQWSHKRNRKINIKTTDPKAQSSIRTQNPEGICPDDFLTTSKTH